MYNNGVQGQLSNRSRPNVNEHMPATSREKYVYKIKVLSIRDYESGVLRRDSIMNETCIIRTPGISIRERLQFKRKIFHTYGRFITTILK